MKELLELIAKALVDNPDEVSVSEVGGEQTTILELRVAQEDLGKVIGKQYRTAQGRHRVYGARGKTVKIIFDAATRHVVDFNATERQLQPRRRRGRAHI